MKKEEGIFLKAPETVTTIQDALVADDAHWEGHRDAFIRARLKALEGTASPEDLVGKRFGLHSGFLHPETKIHVHSDPTIASFRVDDEAIYVHVMDALRQIKSIPEAVQRAIESYFGSSHEGGRDNRSEKRIAFYSGQEKGSTISLRTIKDEKIAFCAERSAVAQNLISFLGEKTWLVDSYASITFQGGKTEASQHIYNVVASSDGGYVLFDVSHPVEVIDEDGDVIERRPSKNRITDEQFAGLSEEKAIEVEHDEIWVTDGEEESFPKKYVYGGPGSSRKT